jgi:hypothetical protein
MAGATGMIIAASMAVRWPLPLVVLDLPAYPPSIFKTGTF